jgi:hypothetical protein
LTKLYFPIHLPQYHYDVLPHHRPRINGNEHSGLKSLTS